MVVAGLISVLNWRALVSAEKCGLLSVRYVGNVYRVLEKFLIHLRQGWQANTYFDLISNILCSGAIVCDVTYVARFHHITFSSCIH